MGMLEWAKREIELACTQDREEADDDGSFDYARACFESAYRAFQSLCADDHSGYSILVTKNILNRLIECKPLTPIEDTPYVWNYISTKDNKRMYQCKRMSSLFKDVYNDGTVKYTDTNRVICICADNPNVSYTNGFVRNLIDEQFPITMPYMPDEKQINVYCEEFLVDQRNGDYDRLGCLYAILPDGKRIDINRFFKEDGDTFKEISRDEYMTDKYGLITDIDSTYKSVKDDA